MSDTMLKVWSKIELWALGCIDRAWVAEVWSKVAKVAKVEPQGSYSVGSNSLEVSYMEPLEVVRSC